MTLRTDQDYSTLADNHWLAAVSADIELFYTVAVSKTRCRHPNNYVNLIPIISIKLAKSNYLIVPDKQVARRLRLCIHPNNTKHKNDSRNQDHKYHVNSRFEAIAKVDMIAKHIQVGDRSIGQCLDM